MHCPRHHHARVLDSKLPKLFRHQELRLFGHLSLLFDIIPDISLPRDLNQKAAQQRDIEIEKVENAKIRGKTIILNNQISAYENTKSKLL